MKMLTVVLKFIVDANIMNLAPGHQERCLKFTTEYLKFINTNLRKCTVFQLQFSEEDLKEMWLYSKSYFSYTTKLLNVVLKSSEATLLKSRAYNLVNENYNLFISVEEILGYGYTSQLVTTIKPWIHDLILALGSCHLLTLNPSVHSTPSENGVSTFWSWLRVLAKIDLLEILNTDPHEGPDKNSNFCAFKRLIEMITALLKSNDDIVDSVGAIFFAGLLHAFETRQFDVVLGILHFICMKLVEQKGEEWKKFKLVSAPLKAIYRKVQVEAKDVEEQSNGEDESRILRGA